MRIAAMAVLAAGCGRLGFAMPDAATDAPDAPSATVLANEVASNALATSISYPLTVLPGADLVLLVSAQVGANSPDTAVPDVVAVTYGTTSLTLVDEVVGIPGNAAVPRSQAWQLVAPPPGTAMVRVLLTATAITLHSGAVEIAGIDQTSPVRMVAHGFGQTATSGVTVAADPGDLVVDFVGQGTGIVATAVGQTLVYLHNSSSEDTLDNSASSSEVAPDTSLTMGWVFTATDYWQQIAIALRPATE